LVCATAPLPNLNALIVLPRRALSHPFRDGAFITVTPSGREQLSCRNRRESDYQVLSPWLR